VASWLNEIINTLDQAQSPVQIFFRDDDAGWENDKLFCLLDSFAQTNMPIDVAVIPENLDAELSSELLSRWQRNKRLLGLHQHGFSHANHELNGRKCEFGSIRLKSQQKDDIAKGRDRLQANFGEAVDPFFTPPWNRCTQDTVECLEELNFKILSRDFTATKLASSNLQQIPVHIDWSKFIKQSTKPFSELGQAIVQNLTSNKITGIMLHHADMDSRDLESLAEMLTMLSNHQKTHSLLLRDTLI
jgi:arsenate reductase-like glutaredoxin family protein